MGQICATSVSHPMQSGSSQVFLSRPLCAMPSLGVRIPILKPARLQRGWYFRSCRQYRTADGVKYNYVLVNPAGKRVQLQPRGPRKLLSYNFPLAGGGRCNRQRLDVHRVLAFNDRGCCNRGWLSWSRCLEVHHKPFPRHAPWTNSCRGNLVVWSRVQHRRWHELHADVPHL